eukprot:8838199-Pyramimonas_sp.AAC.2
MILKLGRKERVVVIILSFVSGARTQSAVFLNRAASCRMNDFCVSMPMMSSSVISSTFSCRQLRPRKAP